MTEELLQIRRAAQKKATAAAAIANRGKKRPAHVIRRISETHKGKILSEETRKKISQNRKGKGIGHTHGFKKGPDHIRWKGGVSSDPEYVDWQKKQHHVRFKNAEGDFTLGEWKLLKEQYGFTCPSCKKKEPEIKLSQDHIIPLSKGGTNYIENIQPLCMDCNLRKYTKIILYEPCTQRNVTIIPSLSDIKSIRPSK